MPLFSLLQGRYMGVCSLMRSLVVFGWGHGHLQPRIAFLGGTHPNVYIRAPKDARTGVRTARRVVARSWNRTKRPPTLLG